MGNEQDVGGMGYDAELQRFDDVFRRTVSFGTHDHVLDIGCGSGSTSRDAARRAHAGQVLGVDVSTSAVEHARRLAAADGIRNITFEVADAQRHEFPADHFDLAISRFGTMFFDSPVHAFANVGRALRPGGRLAMMVWQASERNEWDIAIRGVLTEGQARRSATSVGHDAFSLGEPEIVSGILMSAGFLDATFTDVSAPVYYGQGVATALEWVCGFTSTAEALARFGADDAERVIERLRALLTEHLGVDGVWFDARAWIVTARRD